VLPSCFFFFFSSSFIFIHHHQSSCFYHHCFYYGQSCILYGYQVGSTNREKLPEIHHLYQFFISQCLPVNDFSKPASFIIIIEIVRNKLQIRVE